MEKFVSDVSVQGTAVYAPRKRMRKGTRSCTECGGIHFLVRYRSAHFLKLGRRRKIRCIFPPGDEACNRCSARGSKCIDQRDDAAGKVRKHGPPTPQAQTLSSVSPRPSFDPVITYLLPLQRSELPQDAHISDGDYSDIEAPANPRPPLVSILKNSEDSSTVKGTAASEGATKSQSVHKREASVCETLRAELPSYDAIIVALAKNGSWWDSFRQKTRVISQAEPAEPLLSFAAHAYTSTNPAELGMLSVAYVRSLGQKHNMLDIVDSLIMTDSASVATLEGLECLILLAKTYTDFGQPRRAWLMWRKGIAIAQLMGLHRLGPELSSMQQRIWWAIYHGDRFTSLLLGLPPGFDDDYFDNGSTAGPPACWLPRLIHECAIMAGRVIQYMTSPKKPSFSKSMYLDEQLDSLALSAPAGWWDLPLNLPDSTSELNEMVDRLLIHFFFFHVRMYIHLPFLNSPSLPSKDSVSKSSCTDAARQLLRRYLMLRAERNGASLFDCKTSDFVGFTAAVVLLIGNGSSRGVSRVLTSEDLQLLEGAKTVFQRLEEENRCVVATQCRKALNLLSGATRDGNHGQDIFIPYFGKITRRCAAEGNQAESNVYDANISPPAMGTEVIAASIWDVENAWANAHTFDNMDYDISDLTLDGMWGTGGNYGDGFVLPMGADAASLDIDQDWNYIAQQMNV